MIVVGSAAVESGSGPTEMANSWYSPGSIRVRPSAVQVTVRTALVMVVPSTSTAAGSFCCGALAVHPGTGLVATYRNGWLAGSVTATRTVPAVSDSLGTRRVRTLKPPATGSSASTWTWAYAGSVPASSSPPASVTVAAPSSRH